VDNPHTGDPLGSHCPYNPDATSSTCQGSCLGVVDAVGQTPKASFCTNACVLGRTDNCGYGTDGNGPLRSGAPTGYCALVVNHTYGIGDIGVCAQLCDSTSDCLDQTDSFTCLQDSSFISLTGHGYCSAPTH
jgi:hypothetical protein